MAKIAIICDKRRLTKDRKYPVKLRVTHKGRQKYYPLGKHMSEEKFDRIMDPAASGKNRHEQMELLRSLMIAEEIAGEMDRFSFYDFEKKYLGDPARGSRSVYDRFTLYIDQMNRERRIKTALSYQSIRNSFKKFRPDAELADLNPEFLREYEAWMEERGRTLTTVGIHMRSLRAIYNIAIDQGLARREQYPFGRRRYVIPASRNIKKSLTLGEINQLYRYQPAPGTFADRSKDFWFFSYLCGGLNFKDIAYLRNENICDGFITFVRAKTRLTRRAQQTAVHVPIHADAQRVIDKWGTGSANPKDFVFPILQPEMTLQRQIEVYGQLIHVTNKWMKIIAEEVGIHKKVTTSVARHSHATILKRSGASMEFISEQLGHATLSTTEHYLGSFDDDLKRKFTDQLLGGPDRP